MGRELELFFVAHKTICGRCDTNKELLFHENNPTGKKVIAYFVNALIVLSDV
jgi:hypothetical protein